MNSICLVVDRLHVGYLGCYGNTWIATPALDALACEGLLLDQAVLDTPDVDVLYRSLWRGRHALAAAQNAESGTCLPSALESQGVQTAFITDSKSLTRHPLAARYQQRVALDIPRAQRPAEDESQTHLAQFFAAAMDGVCQARPPFHLWLHSVGMASVWDAPRELRERYAEPGDPEPPEFVEPPGFDSRDEDDPDQLLGIRQAYAAQVSVLDMFIAELTELIREQPWADSTLIVLTSARGYPLGIHGHVGEAGSPDLHSETVQVPLLFWRPGASSVAIRSPAIVQPPDVTATLLQWHGASMPNLWGRDLLPLFKEGAVLPSDRGCVVSPHGDLALRTPAWYWTAPPEINDPASSSSQQLYVKPDDRWEVNDVSDRCPQVVEEMQQVLANFRQAAASGSRDAWSELPQVLVAGLE